MNYYAPMQRCTSMWYRPSRTAVSKSARHRGDGDLPWQPYIERNGGELFFRLSHPLPKRGPTRIVA
jgi:hypothetical protein